MQIAGSLACPMQNGQPQGNLFEKATRVTLFADDLGVRVIFCGFSRITCLHFSRFFCQHKVVLIEEGQHPYRIDINRKVLYKYRYLF